MTVIPLAKALNVKNCCGQAPIADVCGIAEPPRRGFFCAECKRASYSDTFEEAAARWNEKDIAG